MSNVYISLLVLLMSFNLFSISFQINGINRVVINMPLSYFETSIPLTNNTYYFDKDKLESSLTYYLDTNLCKYTNNYSVEFYYYNLEDGSICLTNKCMGVEVSVHTKLNFNYSYSRTMFYEIKEK